LKTVIAISGLAMAGKDSTANFLQQKLAGKTLILHNADYLKHIARAYLGWTGAKDTRGRNLLQALGTDRMRQELQRPLYWVERTCDVIDLLAPEFDYFIVADMRFINEVHYLQARFPGQVTTIRVERLNFDNGLSPAQKNHPSETELIGYPHDYTLVSESGLDHLEQAVDQFLRLAFKEPEYVLSYFV
jgi:hypothetical protein